MTVRKIVQIDEEKCNGCGECIPSCSEGALRIVDGKARLVSDSYCDGLGDCLGTCPRDAIRIVEREAEEFDEEAVAEHLAETRAPAAGCPGAALMDFAAEGEPAPEATGGEQPSALRQWPVQLELLPPNAPYLEGADLLLAADCAPFAMGDFHGRLLAGRKLLAGCPKLDDAERYVQKLTAILGDNDIRSLTVAHMEVPCCFGLQMIVRRAVQNSGSDVPVRDVTIGIKGGVKQREELPIKPAGERS